MFLTKTESNKAALFLLSLTPRLFIFSLLRAKARSRSPESNPTVNGGVGILFSRRDSTLEPSSASFFS